MAVVSISRIQQRRGRAKSGTGLPQLASGELGWAIDTQELYIGNGSVSEGAPAVGNTRILTQYDIDSLNSPANIFGQLTYVYKSSGAITDYSVVNGTNYTDGTYADVTLNWLSGGNQPIANPIVNIVVTDGAVAAVVLVFAGIGVSINAVFDDGALAGIGVLGNGTGFRVNVNDVSYSTGSPITLAVKRSMQARLDDRVNTADFGSVGDGVVNDTNFLQHAINQLFYNSPLTVTSTIDGTLTNNNNVVLCASTNDMVGATVTGNGIQYGTTIIGVTPGISFAMTSNATITGNSTLSLALVPSQNVDYNSAERVILEIPPGSYRITSTLYIPSYATLVGAGPYSTNIFFDPQVSVSGSISLSSTTLNTISADNSMINASISGPGIPDNTTITDVNPGTSLILSNAATAGQTSQTFTVVLSSDIPVIQYINDTSTIGTPGNVAETTYINQPRYITLKNLKISSNAQSQVCLQLDSARNCIFENVVVSGSWGETFNSNSIGINLTAISSLVTSQSNVFKNITVNGFSYGIFSDNDIIDNNFIGGSISDVRYGFALGTTSDGVTVGEQYGPKITTISNFKFSNIKRHAVHIGLGSQNLITDCNLENVGNDGGSSSAPLYPQIYISSYDNVIEKISSDRTKLISSPVSLTKYIPEACGHVEFSLYGRNKIVGLTQSPSPVSLFKLPIPTDLSGSPAGMINYKVDYIFTSTANSYVRSGTLDITLNITTYTVNVPNYANIEVVDEYNYAGLEDFNTGISFHVKLLTSTGTLAIPGVIPFNVMITYTNILSSDVGYLTYTYSYSIL